MTKLFRAIIRSGDPITLSESEADKISMLMLAEDKSRTIKIDESTIRIGDVRRVERDYEGEAAQKAQERKALEQQSLLAEKSKASSRCHGQYSIQREINRIAKEDNPSNWPKLIQDKNWREQIRQQLLKLNSQWCDHKTNACFCDDNTGSFIGARA